MSLRPAVLLEGNVMAAGFQTIDGGSYYFDESGVMTGKSDCNASEG